MDKEYIDTPYNFNEIKNYVITDVEDIGKEIILTPKCYFYDTCSFRNHMMMPDTELLFQYIKLTSGIVIITRTVLMELCSRNGCLWQEHIDYIRKMHLAGIKILVMYEEDIFEILHTYCTDILRINKWLAYAVRCAKSKVGKMEEVIGQDIGLRRYLFEGIDCKDGKLAEKAFRKVRQRKTSGDNMGEELLAVCVHWLSHMRDANPYKYVILSDDKKAVTTFGKVIKNVREYAGVSSIAFCTTTKLCYLMRKSNIICEEKQITGILENSNLEANLNVFCSEEYDLKPVERTMTVEEFAANILNDKIAVYY